MAYRSPTEDSGFRCGLYTAAWNPARKVTSKPASYRFEIVAEGSARPACNTNSPAEALRVARLLAGTGSTVTVRDRSRRRGYLTETELESLTHG